MDIPKKYNNLLNILRESLVEAGGEPLYKPEDFGCNEYYPSKEGIELIFDYGTLHEVKTPDGSLKPFGSHNPGNTTKFMEILHTKLKLEEIKPQRNDKDVDYLTYQLSPSYPIFRLISFLPQETDSPCE